MESFRDISWNISESDYHASPILSYSTLSRYETLGFANLDKLYDRQESPALSFGSAVDCLITEGEGAFQERYLVSSIPSMEPSVEPIVKEIYNQFNNSYTDINDIPETQMMPIIASYGYQPRWNPETRCKAIRKKGQQYYQTMFMAKGREILSQDTYNRVFACVRALKDSPQTKWAFSENNPFDNVERFYQLKFKTSLNGIDYRCMVDELIVNHETRKVIPIDLKTSSSREYDFHNSFIRWHYQIQARLYWRIIRKVMDENPVYREYALANWRFIVVNSIDSPNPLIWEFRDTQKTGTLAYGDIELRDPEDLGKELTHYLNDRPAVPDGIKIEGVNSITEWLRNGRRTVIL